MLAENCCCPPQAMEGFTGVISKNWGTGGVTANVVDPLSDPEAADIVVLPTDRVVSNPAASMPATVPTDEVQVAEFVMSRVVPLLSVAVARSCCVAPNGRVGLVGAMPMETREASPTFKVVEAETDPELALIVAAPKRPLVASPDEPDALLITATVAAEELQLIVEVTSFVLPSV